MFKKMSPGHVISRTVLMLEIIETGTNNKRCSNNLFYSIDFLSKKHLFTNKLCDIQSQKIAYVTRICRVCFLHVPAIAC